MSISILGGGPAGVGTAYYLHRLGIPFELFEKADHLGGNCTTFRCGDHLYDSGAHRFHDRDPEITRDLRVLLGKDLVPVHAPSRIRDGGRYVDFPPTPLNLVFSSRPSQLARISRDIWRSRRQGRKGESFADFAIYQFGETLARRYLLNYSEKVWGLPGEELSPDVATRRLSGMTLRTLVTELFLPGRKSRHIDGSFLYPSGGYGRIVDALVETLPPQRLHTGREVTGLGCRNGRLVEIRFASGSPVPVEGTVVSTLPLTLLVRLLGDEVSREVHEAAARLRFRSVRLMFLRLAQERVSENASIYIPDPNLIVSRLYEPRNRSSIMAPPGETGLAAEVPCFPGDGLWKLSDEELAQRVIDQLSEIDLIRRRRVLEWRHHLLPHAYPVYSLDYRDQVTQVMDALSEVSNLETLGRNGLFFYSHLHHQLRFGRNLAQELRATQAAGRPDDFVGAARQG